MTTEDDRDDWQMIWTHFKSIDQEAFVPLYNLQVDYLYNYGTMICKDVKFLKDAILELFIEPFLKREKLKTSPENLKFYLILALKRCLIKKIQTERKLSRGINETLDFKPEYSIDYH